MGYMASLGEWGMHSRACGIVVMSHAVVLNLALSVTAALLVAAGL